MQPCGYGTPLRARRAKAPAPGLLARAAAVSAHGRGQLEPRLARTSREKTQTYETGGSSCWRVVRPDGLLLVCEGTLVISFLRCGAGRARAHHRWTDTRGLLSLLPVAPQSAPA